MMAERPITGRHVFVGFTLFFGVIVAVNAFMAVSAISTFPGLEAKNGYASSQSFDTRRGAQQALGWQVAATVRNGRLSLAITDAAGRPVRPARVEASIGRPTEDDDDIVPQLRWAGTRFEAPVTLGAGKWVLWLKARAGDGTPFTQRRALLIERN